MDHVYHFQIKAEKNLEVSVLRTKHELLCSSWSQHITRNVQWTVQRKRAGPSHLLSALLFRKHLDPWNGREYSVKINIENTVKIMIYKWCIKKGGRNFWRNELQGNRCFGRAAFSGRIRDRSYWRRQKAKAGLTEKEGATGVSLIQKVRVLVLSLDLPGPRREKAGKGTEVSLPWEGADLTGKKLYPQETRSSYWAVSCLCSDSSSAQMGCETVATVPGGSPRFRICKLKMVTRKSHPNAKVTGDNGWGCHHHEMVNKYLRCQNSREKHRTAQSTGMKLRFDLAGECLRKEKSLGQMWELSQLRRLGRLEVRVRPQEDLGILELSDFGPALSEATVAKVSGSPARPGLLQGYRCHKLVL